MEVTVLSVSVEKCVWLWFCFVEVLVVVFFQIVVSYLCSLRVKVIFNMF